MPLVTVSCAYGLGRHAPYVVPKDVTKALYYLYISIFPFYTGAAASRVSMALMLLRLKQDSRPWRLVLWGIMGAQVCQGIISTVLQTFQCVPVRALWAWLEMDRSEYSCMDPALARIWGWATSGKQRDNFYLLIFFTCAYFDHDF